MEPFEKGQQVVLIKSTYEQAEWRGKMAVVESVAGRGVDEDRILIKGDGGKTLEVRANELAPFYNPWEGWHDDPNMDVALETWYALLRMEHTVDAMKNYEYILGGTKEFENVPSIDPDTLKIWIIQIFITKDDRVVGGMSEFVNRINRHDMDERAIGESWCKMWWDTMRQLDARTRQEVSQPKKQSFLSKIFGKKH